MGVFATVNLSFEAMALFLSVAATLLTCSFPHFGRREKRDLALVLITLFLFALSNGICTVCDGRAGDAARRINVAFRFLSIAAGFSFVAVFNLRLFHLFDRNETGYKIWLASSFVTVGVIALSLIPNLFFGFYYSVNAEGAFAPGKACLALLIAAGMIWVADAALVWANRDKLCKQDVSTFYSFFAMFTAAYVLQCVFIKIAFSDIAAVFAILVLLFGEQSKTTDRLFRERIKTEEAKLEAAQAKERLLRSQVSPHFIYNALTAIQALPDNPEATKKAIGDFAKYLRRSLSTINDHILIPFDKELENVQAYLRLEKIRFGKNLKVEYDVEERAFELPAMCVQILAENAVKHGVSVRRDGGTVRIATRRNGNEVTISVEDDGVGFDTSKRQDSSHIGIDNVKRRLKAMTDGELVIQSEPGKGTRATIRFIRS